MAVLARVILVIRLGMAISPCATSWVSVQGENLLRFDIGKICLFQVFRQILSLVALAIALVLEGASRKVAAESCGMDHQTLRDWIHRYNAEGVDGLRDRGGRRVKPYLTSDQLAQLAT